MTKLMIEFIQVMYKGGEMETSSILIDANDITSVEHEAYGTYSSVKKLGSCIVTNNGFTFKLINSYSDVRQALGQVGINSITCAHPYKAAVLSKQRNPRIIKELDQGIPSDYDVKKLLVCYDDNFYVVSSAVNEWSNETLIFKCDASGQVFDWNQVGGGVDATAEYVVENWDKYFYKTS